MKVLVVVLLIVIALFVVLMVHGAKANDSPQAPGGSPADAQNFNADDYPAVGWLGSALGRFSPKLTVAQIQPPVALYNLQTNSSYTVGIVSDSKHKFRSAKFAVPVLGGQRCAHLVYTYAGDAPTGLGDLKSQDPEKKRGDADKKHPKSEVSFVVLAGAGGTIAITRNGGSGAGCVVKLED
jgi:hypothetical protein